MKVAVFGLGRFGAAAAVKLYDEGAEVLAIDRNLKLVEEVKDRVSVAVACDATDRSNLSAHDVGKMDLAIVAIGTNFEASVLVTLLCKEIAVPRVIAKALTPLQARVLREVGADRVINPEEEMGERVALHVLHGSVVDFVELPANFGLRRVPVPEAWVGKNLSELALLGKERLNLVQIVRPGPGVVVGDGPPGEEDFARWERIPLPHGETVLQSGDHVDVIGAERDLRRLE
jgi:trk system potassium uptake protein TrkA